MILATRIVGGRGFAPDFPLFLVNRGDAGKGEDCESVGGEHWWYNCDNETSGCYHCEVARPSLRDARFWPKLLTGTTSFPRQVSDIKGILK